MMYYGTGMGIGWILILLAVALFALALAGGLATARLRRPGGKSPANGGEPVNQAERILADRFARGEIDAEEYEGRLRTLRAH